MRSLQNARSYQAKNYLSSLDVEIWTDRFRNLGDGNQKAGAVRIAKALIEVYHAVRGIPRGKV